MGRSSERQTDLRSQPDRNWQCETPEWATNEFRRNTVKNTARRVWLAAAVLIPLAVYAQPRPGNPTTATVITKAEIDKISATEQNQTTRDENARAEEHTSELQSLAYLVCRLLLEKKQ